jgi:hypothetical protein
MPMPPEVTSDSAQVQLALLRPTRLLASNEAPAAIDAQSPRTLPAPITADSPTVTQSPITT